MPISYDRMAKQQDLLGYGPELADALDRYISAPESSATRSGILAAYSEWIRKCPGWNHICSADLTFFTDYKRAVRDAITILITPWHGSDGRANHDVYLRMLKEEYLAKQHTMGPHRVFASGMPFCAKCDKYPDTVDELNEFYKEHTHLTESMGSGMLIAEIDDATDPALGDGSSPSTERFLAAELGPTYDKDKFTERFAVEISKKPLTDQWSAWVEVVRTERAKGGLRSCAGRPVRWLAAIPVGYRSRSAPREFQLVSCVFLCFDDAIDREGVNEAIRYVLLNLFEANATRLATRQGEVVARESAVVAAAHELKYIVEAIDPDAPRFALELLREYFRGLFVPQTVDSDTEYGNFCLRDEVLARLGEAARIQHLVTLAKRGSVGNESEDAIREHLNAFEQKVLRSVDLHSSLDIEIKCRASHWRYFQLALLAALRNAVRHAFDYSNRDVSITISAATLNQWRGLLLDIRNSFTSQYLSPSREGKDSGTIAALRDYVKRYNMDAGAVRLHRIAPTTPVSLKNVRVEWQTLLPLPETDGGTGQ